MKRLFRVLLFGCGVLALGLTANAQTWQDPYYTPRNDPYYRNRDGYAVYRYSQQRVYGYGRSGQFLIDRVMADLNRAAERARLDGHERKHFDEEAGGDWDCEDSTCWHDDRSGAGGRRATPGVTVKGRTCRGACY
jgi:hypothetical protein